MKYWVVSSLIGIVMLAGACQPEKACNGGQVLKGGSCVDENVPDASTQQDAGDMDGSSADSDGGSTTPATDAGPIPEAPYCSSRTPLVDEDKYGLKCDAATPGTCGSLKCSFGYCNTTCDLADPCSCPGGSVCTDFGGPTACMPSWGWPCTADSACRAEAPVCIEKEMHCTSVCDPANPKTCPDTWKCASTADGHVCVAQ